MLEAVPVVGLVAVLAIAVGMPPAAVVLEAVPVVVPVVGIAYTLALGLAQTCYSTGCKFVGLLKMRVC